MSCRCRDEPSEPILIWGAGAIGGTLGAYWARAGIPVLLVDFVAEHVRACRTTGWRFRGRSKTSRSRSRRVEPHEVSGTYRRIVLAVKAPATETALEQLAPHLAPDGFVLSAQNGLNEIAIAAKVGAERTMGCFVNFGADWHGPGQILYRQPRRRRGRRDRRRDPCAHTRDARAACDVRARRGADRQYLGLSLGQARLRGDAVRDRADQRLDDGEFCRSPALRVFDTLGREVIAVAKSARRQAGRLQGVRSGSVRTRRRRSSARAPRSRRSPTTRATRAKTHSGIWRDLAVRKRKTEVDPQIGDHRHAWPRGGRRDARARPLVALIHDIEDGRRPLSFATFQELIDTCTSATMAASRS